MVRHEFPAQAGAFGFIHVVLLKPLPYPDSDRLVTVFTAWAHHPTLSPDEGDYMAVPDLRVSRVLLRMRRAQPPLSSPRRLARALPVSCHRNVEVSR